MVNEMVNEVKKSNKYKDNDYHHSSLTFFILLILILLCIPTIDAIVVPANRSIACRTTISTSSTDSNPLDNNFMFTILVNGTLPTKIRGVITISTSSTDSNPLDNYITSSINISDNLPIKLRGVSTISTSSADSNLADNAAFLSLDIEDTTPPSWSPTPANQTVELGTAFSYTVYATDLQTVTYSINDTSNFKINSSTGT